MQGLRVGAGESPLPGSNLAQELFIQVFNHVRS